VESALRAGHPDVEGLCRALADWSGELRLIKQELALRHSCPTFCSERAGGYCTGTEKSG
jgi:hypothetical protein